MAIHIICAMLRENLFSGFPPRLIDINEIARGLEVWIQKLKSFYHLGSENTAQHASHCGSAADLHFCFSHSPDKLIYISLLYQT